jgi:rubrerythrin
MADQYDEMARGWLSAEDIPELAALLRRVAEQERQNIGLLLDKYHADGSSEHEPRRVALDDDGTPNVYNTLLLIREELGYRPDVIGAVMESVRKQERQRAKGIALDIRAAAEKRQPKRHPERHNCYETEVAMDEFIRRLEADEETNDG